MKLIKTKQKPLPKSHVVTQTQNYRIVQEYYYEGDYLKGCSAYIFSNDQDPYRIIEKWIVEKKETNLMGETSWHCYDKNRNYKTMYSPQILIELFNLKGGH